MNLLTGLAVDDTEKIRHDAETKRRQVILNRRLQIEFLEIPSFFQERVKKSIKKSVTTNLDIIEKRWMKGTSYIKSLFIDDLEGHPNDYKNAAGNCLWVQDETVGDIQDVDLKDSVDEGEGLGSKMENDAMNRNKLTDLEEKFEQELGSLRSDLAEILCILGVNCLHRK